MAKTILITGGAGGICSELCRALASDGLNVAVADFDIAAAEKLAAEICNAKGGAIAVQVDVGDAKSVAAMIERTVAEFGQIDVLLCGAGVMDRVPVVEMPEAMWDRLMRINLKGVFLCPQAAARHMIPRNAGRMLNIASGRGIVGQARAAHYAASKAAVIAYSKSLADELAPHNIAVNCICPGAVDTPLARAGVTDAQFRPKHDIPPMLNGLTQKFEVVGLVRYLLSDAAQYVTGQNFFLRTAKY